MSDFKQGQNNQDECNLMPTNETNVGATPQSVIIRKSGHKYYAICSSHVVVGEGENLDAAYEDLLAAIDAHAELAKKANYDEEGRIPKPQGFKWGELKMFSVKLMVATFVFGVLFASLTFPVANVLRQLTFNVMSPEGSNLVDIGYQLRLKGMAVIEKLENMDPKKKAALAADLRRFLEQLRPFIAEVKEFNDSILDDRVKFEQPANKD
jgi:hypothetical protein